MCQMFPEAACKAMQSIFEDAGHTMEEVLEVKGHVPFPALDMVWIICCKHPFCPLDQGILLSSLYYQLAPVWFCVFCCCLLARLPEGDRAAVSHLRFQTPRHNSGAALHQPGAHQGAHSRPFVHRLRRRNQSSISFG